MHSEKPPHNPPMRALAVTAAAAYLAAAALWFAQAIPALRINNGALVSAECWLFAYGCFGLKTAMTAPRYAWVSRVLAIGTVINDGAPIRPPRGRAGAAVARRAIYTACGYVAAAALTAAAATDILLATGAIHLRGVNLFLTLLFMLGAASESAAVRVLGPAAAASELALAQAYAAARHQLPPTRAPLEVLNGGKENETP